jgi:hypothetical protein
MGVMSKSSLLLVAVFLLSSSAAAQDKFDIFFLAVGSGNYAVSKVDGVKGLHQISGAVKSAKAVADLLEQGGSTFGITLVSDNAHFVGRDDVVNALSRVFDEIRTMHPRHPLVLFYFAGHGVADGGTWDHFSLPGTFLYRGELVEVVAQHGPAMANVTIHAGTLVAWLRDANLPFLLLLDNCYEGEPWVFQWKPTAPPPDTPCPTDPINGPLCLEFKKRLGPVSKLDAQMPAVVNGFNEMLANFRRANRFENTYPVLFSTTPGTTVATVADPFNPSPTAEAVAPLARRAMLILTPILKQGESLSLEAFIQKMTSPKSDDLTQPAVTYSAMPSDASFLIASKRLRNALSESRIGTAVTPVVCCDDAQMLSSPPGPK